MDDLMEESQEAPDLTQETPAEDVFIAPSISRDLILSGASYSHFTPIPSEIASSPDTEIVLGVDEAGRGPVLGPMVYGIYYLPLSLHRSLLADTHHFDDSKVLTATVRSQLMEKVCTPGTDLHSSCGWATRVMSARDISAGQLKPNGTYNLNAQAMDATMDLIKEVFAMGVNVKEIYVDTIGSPATYQKKLERVFPTAKVTVAKKADSLYPCVSAASVVAKVTRDAALEVCYEAYQVGQDEGREPAALGWGSGYPGDARCSSWLKKNMDPLFGWGAECRFSWSTAKDMLDGKDGIKVRWPTPDDEEGNMKLTDFAMSTDEKGDELANWYGTRVTEAVF
ncbi:Ribonuclease H2 subunit A [Sphaceloma murrayae]|uniref:Ribonuclease n=1 Tax=Sphaceloma murrayae TaxID=2082308 RepID=A0A2K1QH64_9PEZI|nr:Ribonuclease H2 subunit A [Sphaceloma murrayae]